MPLTVWPWRENDFRALAAFYYNVDRYLGLAEAIAIRDVDGPKQLKLREQASGVAHSALEFVDGAERAAK